MARTSARRPVVIALLAATLAGVPASALAGQAGPAPARTGDGFGTLRAQVLSALRASTARHVALRADVAGLGTIRRLAATRQPPASNEKLFVAETALQQLGPAFRYDTEVYADGTLAGSTLTGDLVLHASGDPLLTDADLGRLAAALRAAGLRRVRGDVVVDASLFSRDRVPGWKSAFVPYELGPVSAFSVDEDSWSISPAFLTHPALANAGRWRQALRRGGITATGGTVLRAVPTGSLEPLAGFRSRPLARIVTEMLTESDNYTAEMVLLELGAARTGHGTRVSGLAAVHAEVAALHATAGRLVDGSGLSYADAESPSLLVGWLDAIARSSTGSVLRAALPRSCQTGTLVGRLCGPGLTGRVVAKTGTLLGIRTLSGYTRTRSGRAVTFSVMMSGIADMNTAEQRMDAAVAVLARWRH